MAKQNLNLESGWDLLFVVGIVGVLAAGYYAFVPPKARPNPVAGSKKSLSEIQKGNVSTVAKADHCQNVVKSRTWDVPPESLNARMMEKLTGIAGIHHVQLANFQVGRPIHSAALIQTPFTVTLQGTFEDVLQTIEQIENPTFRIAISGLKLEPAKMVGSAANTVSTTLNLTAFLYKEKD